jgi:hypothetical protein
MSLDLNAIRGSGIRGALNSVAEARAASEAIKGIIYRMQATGVLRSSSTMLDQYLVGRAVNIEAVAGQLERDAEALSILAETLGELASMVRDHPGRVELAPSTPAGLARGETRTW